MIKAALSRRGIFKAAPAVALAAPSLVDEVKASAGGMPMGSPPMIGSLPQYGTPQWVAKQKQLLLDRIAGKRDPEQELMDRYADRISVAMHYDGLRSVSPVMRAKMFVADMINRNHEREREGASFSLARLLRGEY